MTSGDDRSVLAETRLYRRIHPNFIVHDHDRDCNRLSQGAFNDPEMSVHLGHILEQEDREPADVLSGFTGHCLVSIAAEVARKHGQAIVPSATDDDRSHGEVVGDKPKTVRRAFVASASWEVPPEDPCPEEP